MKLVILAGGLGTRLVEETSVRPKPMVEIGGKPILWHVMKIYASHGVNEFIICAGYKGYMIKEYFANYFLHTSDVTFDIANNSLEVHERHAEPWKVTVVDTGEETLTGGRMKRVASYVGSETFCMTYGDGVGDVNITELIAHHRKTGVEATVTAVRPPARFGLLKFKNSIVTGFQEKPEGDGTWINGGFFVLEPSVLKRIAGDSTTWEREPVEAIVREGRMSVYQHQGFWQAMDTLRDKRMLEELWESGKAPWKSWKS